MAEDKDYINAYMKLSPSEKKELSNVTKKRVRKAYFNIAKGRTVEGAKSGGAFDELGRVATGKVFRKGQTPKEVGQSIKDVAKVPINLATMIPGAISGAVLGGTGASEKIAEKMGKMSPEDQEKVGTALELLGLVGLRGLKAPKIKMKPKLKKIEAKKAKEILETGREVGEDVAGADIISKGGQKVIKIGKEQFAPAKKSVERLPVSKNIGKELHKEITDGLTKSASDFDVHPKNIKPILDNIGFVKNAKNLKDLIKAKQLIDKQFRGMWKDNPTIADEGMRAARRFINDKIKNNIKDLDIKNNWIEANQSWQNITDGMELLKRAEKMKEASVFKALRNKKAIEDAQTISGVDTIKVAGMSDLFSRATDGKTGLLIPGKYAKAIRDIGEIRGKAVFGEDWKILKKLQTIVRDFESPQGLVRAVAKDLPGIKSLAKYMGGKEFERILKGKTADVVPLKVTDKIDAAISPIAPGIVKGASEELAERVKGE